MATVTGFDLNGSQSGLDETRSYQKGSDILLAPNATVSATGNFNGQTLAVTSLAGRNRDGLRRWSFGIGQLHTYRWRQDRNGIGDGADLVFHFNSSATASHVQTLIRNLTFWDEQHNPAVSRAITFNLAGTTRNRHHDCHTRERTARWSISMGQAQQQRLGGASGADGPRHRARRRHLRMQTRQILRR